MFWCTIVHEPPVLFAKTPGEKGNLHYVQVPSILPRYSKSPHLFGLSPHPSHHPPDVYGKSVVVLDETKQLQCRYATRCMLEGTTDQRGRLHPPQCTTLPSTRIIRCRVVCPQDSIAWFTLDAEPQTFSTANGAMTEWNEVVFTDESRILLQHHDCRIRIWRHRGETSE
ncbi:hypothetical protein TNCV_1556811 [Trichonephila clavipes]|nr:hypothetical protein TNCV_1556811 [Trichonephila clavipes]